MKRIRTLLTTEHALAILRLKWAAFASLAFATVVHADAVCSDAVQICLQTDAAGFYRMTENRLNVSWDWSWEWVPGNACAATVSFSADFLDEARTTTVTDTTVTNVVMENLFAVGREMPMGAGTVTLTFSNAVGSVRSKSYSVDILRGAFTGVDVRCGPTDRNHWQAIAYPVVIPFDTRWFVNTASSAHLLWTDPATGECWTNSFTRGMGAAVYRDAKELPKKPLQVELWFWNLDHAVNKLYTANLDIQRGGTMLILR